MGYDPDAHAGRGRAGGGVRRAPELFPDEPNGRALADWTLYASEDGLVWDEVARYDWDADTMPASDRWFSDGTNDKDVARPGKGYPVLVSFSNDPFANVSAVSVASNATLKAVGRVALGRIAVDVSGAGNGTLDGFSLDESGFIFATGAGSLAGSLLVPVAFVNCTGLENVSKWQVCVGGVPTARWRAKATQSGLKFFSTGTQMLIR